MLSVKNLVKTYKVKDSGEVKALNGVSIDFPKTGMVFILGKSGSGKSTLLNIASGLDKPSEGEIIVNNKSSKNFSNTDFDGYRNKYVGFVFQEYNILEQFTVGENIALALELQGKKNNDATVEKILDETGLSQMSKRKPNTLSGGQKQRVAIARALVKDPEVIFADEPTGALDSETSKDIFDTLKDLSKHRLVVVVSHDREYAVEYGDRIIELKDGKVFSDTNNGHVSVMSTDTAVFKKSSLPILRTIKLGASSLKCHKVRLTLTLLTAIISFTMFGVVSTMMTYNSTYTAASAISSSGYSAALMTKNYWYDFEANCYNIDGDSQLVGEGSSHAKFTKAEIAEINKMTSNAKLNFAGVFMTGKENEITSDSFLSNLDAHLYDTSYTPKSKIADYYSTDINWFSDCGEEYMTQAFGNDCLIAGRYPKAIDEIALSQYHYSVFEKYGYTSVDSKPSALVEQIKSPNDLVGKVLKLNYYNRPPVNMTITGIYNVGDMPKSEELKKSKENMSEAEQLKHNLLKEKFDNEMKDSFHMTAFVTEDFYEQYGLILSKSECEDIDTGTANLKINNNTVSEPDTTNTDFMLPTGLSTISGARVYYYDGSESKTLSSGQCLVSIGG